VRDAIQELRGAIDRTKSARSFAFVVDVADQPLTLPGEQPLIYRKRMAGFYEAPGRFAFRVIALDTLDESPELFLSDESYVCPREFWEAAPGGSYKACPRSECPHADPFLLLDSVLQRGDGFAAASDDDYTFYLDGEALNECRLSIAHDRVSAMALRFNEPMAPIVYDVSFDRFDDRTNPNVSLPRV
jgi:hypothetical protein